MEVRLGKKLAHPLDRGAVMGAGLLWP